MHQHYTFPRGSAAVVQIKIKFMSTSQSYRDLFRRPTLFDDLNLFQSLLGSKDLIPDLALALINIIRAELEQPQKQGPFAYRRYAEVMTCFCAQMPGIYEQVAAAWQQRRRNAASARLPESLEQETPPPEVVK